MGSTDERGPTQVGPQRSLFENAGRDAQKREEVERDLSANPNVPFHAESALSQSAEDARLNGLAVVPEYVEPVWIQRIKLMIFVTFCIWVGMLLVVLPWTPVWSHNNVLLAHPDLRAIFQHFFTRGAVSGLGLVDVWIGIWAAVKYHDKK